MRVTYYALRDIRVGDEVRQCGDLVPEAGMWPYLSGYITDGKIAPVLVATLPEEQQVMLLEWEEEVMGVTHDGIPAAEETTKTDDQQPVTTDKIDKRTKAYKDAVAAQKTEA